MSLTQLAMVFFATFGVVSFLLVAGFLTDALKGLRNRPEQPHVVLGNDLRGRTVTVLDVLSDGTAVNVQIGPERWRARLAGQSRRTVRVGDRVTINRVEGLTLVVSPEAR